MKEISITITRWIYPHPSQTEGSWKINVGNVDVSTIEEIHDTESGSLPSFILALEIVKARSLQLMAREAK